MSKEELIEKYFKETLSETERAQFNTYLNEDESFKKEFEFISNLQETIVQKEREETKALLQSFEQSVKQRNWKKWLVAASIVLLLGLGYSLFFLKPSPDQLFASNFEPYANVIQPVVRGLNESDLKTKAFVAYENKEYELAETYFSQIYTKDKEPYSLFYLANTELAMGNISEGKRLLNNYLELPIDSLTEKANWYLALAHLKGGEIEDAQRRLRKIIQEDGYQSKQAKLILKKLN